MKNLRDDIVDIWAKKSPKEEMYSQRFINLNHIISIDLEEDYIQVNLINGITYYTFYDVNLSMISLGLTGDELDAISMGKGFKKDNPDFDIIKYRNSFYSEIKSTEKQTVSKGSKKPRVANKSTQANEKEFFTMPSPDESWDEYVPF